ncbi:MAG TPA: PepSY domain-containing protein [Dehalococcoidia bacterium]|nr:PepSY domain-containing protein [Dehalococcoidia bacterium]
MKRRVLLGIVIFVLAGTAIALGAVGILPGIFTEQKRPPEQEQAIEIGREYLEDIGRQPGKVLSVDLKHRDEVPDSKLFYWQLAHGVEVPDVPEPEWCWVVSFEQGHRPGHWWEVLIDADTAEVVGRSGCR